MRLEMQRRRHDAPAVRPLQRAGRAGQASYEPAPLPSHYPTPASWHAGRPSHTSEEPLPSNYAMPASWRASRPNHTSDERLSAAPVTAPYRAGQRDRDSRHSYLRGESYEARLRRLRSRVQDLLSSSDDDDYDMDDPADRRYRFGPPRAPPSYSSMFDSSSRSAAASRRNLSSFSFSDDVPPTISSWFDVRRPSSGRAATAYNDDVDDLAVRPRRRQWGEATRGSARAGGEGSDDLDVGVSHDLRRNSIQHLWYGGRGVRRANALRERRETVGVDDDDDEVTIRLPGRRPEFRYRL